MKILHVTQVYPQALARFNKAELYGKVPDTLEVISGLDFGWSDFYVRAFQEKGIDANIILGSDEVLLKKMYQNVLPLLGEKKSVLLDILLSLDFELLFLEDPFVLSEIELNKLKEFKKNIVLVGYLCSPVSNESIKRLNLFDLVLTCTPGFVEIFTNSNLNSYLLPHAFEKSLFEKYIGKTYHQRTKDVVFSGGLIGHKGFHQERIKLIDQLLKANLNINLYSDYGLADYKRILAKFVMNVDKYIPLRSFIFKKIDEKITSWNDQVLPSSIVENLLPALFGGEMYKVFGDSKIILNTHGEVAGDWAGNMRLFEATGMGACLVTDHKKNIKDYFEPDLEIVTYKSAEECAEKVSWLLKNPSEAAMIAERGMRRCHEEHNFQNRSSKFLEIVKKM